MSIPISGGTPSVLASGNYQPQCALPHSTICVLSENNGTRVNFYWFDSKRGRGAEPFKSMEQIYDWGLSPDGREIAVIKYKQTSQSNVVNTQLQIFRLSGGTERTLELAKWTQSELQTLNWFVNGKGLYVTAFLPSGTALLSVDFTGNDSLLFQQERNWLCCPRPAPNGELLAFSVSEFQTDVLMMENF